MTEWDGEWDEKIKQKIQNLVINQKDFMAETISTKKFTNVVVLSVE